MSQLDLNFDNVERFSALGLFRPRSESYPNAFFLFYYFLAVWFLIFAYAFAICHDLTHLLVEKISYIVWFGLEDLNQKIIRGTKTCTFCSRTMQMKSCKS